MNLKKVRRNWQTSGDFKGFKVKGNFYTSKLWRDLREVHLSMNPLCKHCEQEGKVKEGNWVDHILPISKGGKPLDPNNLQTLCQRHNAIKTAKDRH